MARRARASAAIDAAEGKPRPMIGIERFAFYDMARKSYAVIQTGERRAGDYFVEPIMRRFGRAMREE